MNIQYLDIYISDYVSLLYSTVVVPPGVSTWRISLYYVCLCHCHYFSYRVVASNAHSFMILFDIRGADRQTIRSRVGHKSVPASQVTSGTRAASITQSISTQLHHLSLSFPSCRSEHASSAQVSYFEPHSILVNGSKE